MASRVEDLPIWRRARDLAAAVADAAERPAFTRQPRLAGQLNDAADSLLANIAEGFGQQSNQAFARYLAIARGSCNEIRSHLVIGEIRHCIPAADCHALCLEAEEISRMLTGFSRYLLRSSRPDGR